jgi:5-methyltetrahydrofolate--homocysteine methyltransferase
MTTEYWEHVKTRHEEWWTGRNTGGPIMGVLAPRANGASGERVADRWVESSGDERSAAQERKMPQVPDAETLKNNWTSYDVILARNLAMFDMMHVCGDGYPRIFGSLGPASLAAFLGAEMTFSADTVWYHPILENAAEAELHMDRNHPWLQWSLDTTARLHKAEAGRYVTGIPELCEQADVLSCLFDSQQFLYELIDSPKEMHRLLRSVQDAWFTAYDLHHAQALSGDGFVCYGPFALLGKGRIAKIQCDVSAVMSPAMYAEFVLPYLTELTEKLDRTLYHLDGEDALKHLDAVLAMPKLSALQWTSGAGRADGGDECWDFLYTKALNAGKSIYALVHPKNLARFVKRFGGKGVYIVTQADSPENADRLVEISRTLSSGN